MYTKIIRKFKIFSGEIPPTPHYERGGVCPLSCSPPTRVFGTRIFSVFQRDVPWPDHLSKADDGPEMHYVTLNAKWASKSSEISASFEKRLIQNN